MKKNSLIIVACLFLFCFVQTDLAMNNANNQTQISNPDAKNAELQAIQAASLRGDYQAAEKLLTDYQRNYGEDTQYLIEKARYFSLNGNPQAALKMVEPLLKNDPQNKTLLDIKDYALSHSTNAATINNPEFPQVNPDVSAASQASDAGDYKKAVVLYKQALGKNSTDKAGLIGLARTYLFMTNYKDGEKILAQYKKTYGEDDQYLTEKARDLAFTNHPQQSLNVLAPLLKKNPTNDDLLDIKKYATDRLKASNKQGNSAKTVSKKGSPAKKTVSPLTAAKKASAFAKQRNNPQAFAIAAKDYVDAGDAKSALVMIDDALNLDPKNYNYLLLKAEIADRLENHTVSYKTYEKLYKINSSSPKIILGFARAAGGIGWYEQSVGLYKLYLKNVPNDKAAWLEYAYIQSFRGNSRGAINILDEYYRRFGGSDTYWAVRARILAAAGQFTESFAIVNSLLPRLPKNYDLNFANTVNFFYNNRPIEMFESFKRVNALDPNSNQTNGLWSFIYTPYRSNINLDLYRSFDSDTVKITHGTLSGQYYLSPLTSLIGNVTNEGLTATVPSGLNPIQGGHLIHLNGANIGINHRINPKIAVQGLIGGQNGGYGGNSFNYEADALMNPSENLALNLQVRRAFYDQSARAVSLSVKQNLGQATLLWQPFIQCYLLVNGGYATFTDGNTLRVAEIRPTVQVLSTERLNVTLGVDGIFNKFGKVLTNGYYSPTNYKYGGVTSDFYVKYSDDVGFSLSLGFGSQRDQTFTSWRPANDYTLKGYFGIYQNWLLTFTGALSTRGVSIANNVKASSTYKVYAFDLTITRRLG